MKNNNGSNLWIGGRFFKLTEAERRHGLKYLKWLQPTNDPNIPWIKPMEIIQFEQAVAAEPPTAG